MVIANIISLALVVIGCLNWGLVGIFNFNLVTSIFGAYPSALTIVTYILVAAAAIWLVVSAIMYNGRIVLCERAERDVK